MTANQIIIPLAIAPIFAFVGYLIIHEKRSARRKANAQREHRPNTPHDGRDDGAVARSITEGHASGNQF